LRAIEGKNIILSLIIDSWYDRVLKFQWKEIFLNIYYSLSNDSLVHTDNKISCVKVTRFKVKPNLS